MNKEIQQEVYSKLSLVDDQAKPMAGTDITGVGQFQYTRLCLIELPAGSYQIGKFAKPRIFAVFAESQKLFDWGHAILQTPEWIKEGFEDKSIYIEEVLHRPRAGETLNEYTTVIAQFENDIWLAVFQYITSLGILDRSAKKFITEAYKIPKPGGSNLS